MNTKSIFFSFLVLSSIHFSSCRSGIYGPTKVEGIVIDATTGDPIYDAQVYLLEAKLTGEIFGPPPAWYGIDSIQTGAFGRFEFGYDNREGYTYSVYAYKYNYFENVAPEQIIEENGHQNLEIEIFPIAYLTMRIHNINDYDEWDYLVVNDLYESFYGNSIDTSITIDVYGNTSETITWFVNNDGVFSTAFNYEIYCPPFDTTFFEILY